VRRFVDDQFKRRVNFSFDKINGDESRINKYAPSERDAANFECAANGARPKTTVNAEFGQNQILVFKVNAEKFFDFSARFGGDFHFSKIAKNEKGSASLKQISVVFIFGLLPI
jgi:hypothetical protein